MRKRLFLIVLALAGSVHAAEGVAVGHSRVPDGDEAGAMPMRWRYGLLQAAQDRFRAGVAAQAPGASLVFRLPKADAAETGHHVALVTAEGEIPLAMVSGSGFVLPPDTGDLDAGAEVRANRNFARGEFNHPNVQVRSPGLPDGVRRVGDLRLACAAQMAMAKAEGFKFRAVLATASLFGLDICDKLEIARFDAPGARYDSVTIEDGARRLVLSRTQKDTPALGDKDWSDDARVRYTLDGQVVR